MLTLSDTAIALTVLDEEIKRFEQDLKLAEQQAKMAQAHVEYIRNNLTTLRTVGRALIGEVK